MDLKSAVWSFESRSERERERKREREREREEEERKFKNSMRVLDMQQRGSIIYT
jgi:hypothetical protein